MSREIKFRVFDKKYGMFDVLHIDFVNDEVSYMIDYNKITGTMIDEHEFDYGYAKLSDLMQYTGLKDINGKEIYEGDIVKLPNGEFGSVVFGTNRLNQNYYSVTGFSITSNGYYYPFDCTDEIIGNIYENPELLEK